MKTYLKIFTKPAHRQCYLATCNISYLIEYRRAIGEQIYVPALAIGHLAYALLSHHVLTKHWCVLEFSLKDMSKRTHEIGSMPSTHLLVIINTWK